MNKKKGNLLKILHPDQPNMSQHKSQKIVAICWNFNIFKDNLSSTLRQNINYAKTYQRFIETSDLFRNIFVDLQRNNWNNCKMK